MLKIGTTIDIKKNTKYYSESVPLSVWPHSIYKPWPVHMLIVQNTISANSDLTAIKTYSFLKHLNYSLNPSEMINL